MSRARLAAAIGTMALASCSLAPWRPPASVAPADAARTSAPSNAAELLAYMQRLRTLTEPGLLAEAARRRQVLLKDTTDVARVKAALAIMLAAPADDAEVATLVEPIVKRDGGDADVRAMASFLHAIAADRRRQRESAAAAANRARDERRAVEAQKQRADALQERAAQLQQKLDALTEIERSLSDRQGPPR